MTSGRCKVDVEGGASTNLCAINHRASFLLVKPSTIDLARVLEVLDDDVQYII